MGHHTVKRTEEYVLTEEEAIKSEMQILKGKLEGQATKRTAEYKSLVEKLESLDLNQEKLTQLIDIVTKLV